MRLRPRCRRIYGSGPTQPSSTAGSPCLGQDACTLGPVALERVDHQRRPGGVGQQADGDLWLEAASLGEPGVM